MCFQNRSSPTVQLQKPSRPSDRPVLVSKYYTSGTAFPLIVALPQAPAAPAPSSEGPKEGMRVGRGLRGRSTTCLRIHIISVPGNMPLLKCERGFVRGCRIIENLKSDPDVRAVHQTKKRGNTEWHFPHLLLLFLKKSIATPKRYCVAMRRSASFLSHAGSAGRRRLPASRQAR